MRALGPAEIEGWRALEQAALEGNAFASPDFVRPALEHLLPWARPIAVRAIDGERTLALGLFEPAGPSRSFPLPHLRAWRTPHTFLDGWLLDAERGAEAAAAVEHWFRHTQGEWFGIAMAERRLDGPRADAWRAQRRLRWHPRRTWSRAAFDTRLFDGADPLGRLSSVRRRGTRRAMSRLEQAGAVVRVERPEAPQRLVGAFLHAEAAGWKGERGTAMAGSPHDVAFLHAMTSAFSIGSRAVFARVEDATGPLAVSCSLVSGRSGFAFKIGVTPAGRRFSAGILAELELARRWAQAVPGVPEVDGCAAPGAYLESIWREERRLSAGVWTFNARGAIAARVGARLA